ncbi:MULTISPECIES: class F sortase [Lentzea]|uniref:Sortase family protein n=1 Tax=Lentzea albida TaxID=65499 RepID=A0A1H9EEY5_9PSEU|nr:MULTISPECIES: class F sortase [Lentzea]USX55374.1 class F sortase [Lentzea sp. HUAS12]SEQ24142.1 Sortase family protein [Lentzea albida]
MAKAKLLMGAAIVVTLIYVVKGPGGDEAPEPVTVLIPSIGVETKLESLDVDSSGALEPPTRADKAGWFAKGVAPGDRGPAVIAGHVDSKTGPGVFFRLPELQPGAEVLVEREDGSRLTFVVSGTHTTEKTLFPTAAVYGPTPLSELRLVTCGGEFDRVAGSYRDNIIVDAVLKA